MNPADTVSFVKELARRILVALDPDELLWLDTLPDNYAPDPRRRKRVRTGPADAGLTDTVVALAPAIMWVAQCVTNAIIEYHVHKTIQNPWGWLRWRRRKHSSDAKVDVMQAVTTAEGWAIVQVTVVRSAGEAGLSLDQINKILEVLKPGQRSGDQENVGEE